MVQRDAHLLGLQYLLLVFIGRVAMENVVTVISYLTWDIFCDWPCSGYWYFALQVGGLFFVVGERIFHHKVCVHDSVSILWVLIIEAVVAQRRRKDFLFVHGECYNLLSKWY